MESMRLQDDGEEFEQVKVNAEDYFPAMNGDRHAFGTLAWFTENDDACITQLRVKDGARKGYVNEWNDTGTSVLHRIPTRGRERRLLDKQAELPLTSRTPFSLIRMIGSTAYDYGKYVVEKKEARRGLWLRRVLKTVENTRASKKRKIENEEVVLSSLPPEPPTASHPMYVTASTTEPVKSSSEGRHLNMLREVFGKERVHYEPMSFKVKAGHIHNYTPDFIIQGKTRHVVLESKSSMSGVTSIAIRKAAGVAAYGFPTYFIIGPPCDLMVWALHPDVPAILPARFENIVEDAGGR